MVNVRIKYIKNVSRRGGGEQNGNAGVPNAFKYCNIVFKK